MTKETRVGLIVLIVILAIGFALVAWASTALNFSHTFNLTPGTYCLESTQTVDGSELEVTVSVTDGECDNGGETIVIEATPSPSPSPVPAPEVCPLESYDNVIDERGNNASSIRGTRDDDIILADSGVKVRGRGGNDCILVGSGSKVYGQSGDDYIVTGSGSWVRGGSGEDVCFAGIGSNVKCELVAE